MTDGDDRVVALLHDLVPAVPDMPDRLDAVRHRAGRQRAQLWTQTIGAVAAVVMLMGLVAAVAAPRGGEVHPVRDPLRDVPAVVAAQQSVSFSLSTRPVGALPTPMEIAGIGVSAASLTGTTTGSVAANGDFVLDGSMSSLSLIEGGIMPKQDLHLRSVGGYVYRTAMPFEKVPDGKKWVREELTEHPTPADVERMLRLGLGFVANPRYTGQGVVRGTRVAEYDATVPGRWVGGEDITVSFAVDGEGRPRRVSGDVDVLRLMRGLYGSADPSSSFMEEVPALVVHVELDLFDYGKAVDVTPPPAAEVIDSGEVDTSGFSEGSAGSNDSTFDGTAMSRFSDCMDAAGSSATAQAKCQDELRRSGSGLQCTSAIEPDGSHSTTCTDPGGTTSTGMSSTVVGPPPAPGPSPGSRGSGSTGTYVAPRPSPSPR
jgi:hypothetical protein